MEEQMIKHLERIAKSMEKSAAVMSTNKAPDLWDTEDIATWLHMDFKVTRDRIIKQPDFPVAFCPTGSRTGRKLWFSADVIEWARLNIGKFKKAA